jgi:surface antigen
MTRPGRLLQCAAILALALIPLPTLAGSLVNPFDSSGNSLSDEDGELMKGALKSVLDAKKPGATADWKSPSSGLAGRATALDLFEMNGMPCANVEHAFTAGGGSTYRLPFCQIADGSWKIAF